MRLLVWIVMAIPLGSVAFAQTGNGASSATSAVLPKDIDPQSFSRLPVVKREDLDEDGKRLYDIITARTIAGLRGPAGISLYSPKVARSLLDQQLYLTTQANLGGRIRELAILVAAREMNSQFEWTVHEPLALAQGVDRDLIERIKVRGSLDGVVEEDAVVISLAREAFSKPGVTLETFIAAHSRFGDGGVVDLTALVGQYAALSILLKTFDMQLDRGQKPLLPMQ